MDYNNFKPKKCQVCFFLVCISVLVVFLTGSNSVMAKPAFQMAETSQNSFGEIPSGVSVTQWKDIKTQIISKRYFGNKQDDGSINALNPAHNFQIHYKTNGVTAISPPMGNDYLIELKLIGLGYQLIEQVSSPLELSNENNTVSYKWSDELTEIWSNSENSLEQWFVLKNRPGNLAGEPLQGPLQLQMSLHTDLTAMQRKDGFYLSNEQGIEISYTKLKVWDSKGSILPSKMLIADSGRVTLQIDDSQAVYPLTIDPVFQQQAYLKASNAEAGDQFGTAVAISGNTLVVGAPFEDGDSSSTIAIPNDSAVDAGAVYVFTRSGGNWALQAYLKASNAGGNDQFGTSVAVSADTIVVGAPFEQGDGTSTALTPNDIADEAGAAYVFTRNGTNWTQQAYLKALNVDAGDRFGISVAINNDTVVVGSYFEDGDLSSSGVTPNNNDPSAGAAYVFVRSGVNWSQQAYLKASNAGSSDRFGRSVTIDGDTLVVGANREDGDSTSTVAFPNNSASAAGAAYVFTRSGTTWAQEAYLKASNAGINDRLGQSLALSGDSLVVGAINEDGDSSSTIGLPNESAVDAGAAYVFTRSGSVWTQQAYLKASNAGTIDRFGRSVSLSNDTLVVGARLEDGDISSSVVSPNDLAGDAGAAYVFTRSGGAWTQENYLKAFNAEGADLYGHAVALSTDTLVIGAYQEDGDNTSTAITPNNLSADAGAVYIYTSPTNSVPVVTNVNITGTAAVGNMLTGNYSYADIDGDLEGVSTYRWLRGGVAIPSAVTSTYTLVAADSGQNISFEVTPVAATGVSPGIAVISPSVLVANTPPTASSVNITGTAAVGNMLTGSYSYADVDGDAEGTSTYRWLRGGVAIPSAVTSTYTLVAADSGQNISFEVTPVAATGVSPGIAVISPSVLVANTPPTATSVNITGTAAVGNMLTGSYSYADVDGDAEGTSTYRWLRGGVAIPSATASIYTLVAADSEQDISFEVTPVATTGASPGMAAASLAVLVANTPPFATDVSIIGTPAVGNILTGVYTYGDVDGDLEGNSIYQWYRNGNIIPGAAGSTYTLSAADSGAVIVFEVTPVASTGTGTTVGSAVTAIGIMVAVLAIPTLSYTFMFVLMLLLVATGARYKLWGS